MKRVVKILLLLSVTGCQSKDSESGIEQFRPDVPSGLAQTDQETRGPIVEAEQNLALDLADRMRQLSSEESHLLMVQVLKQIKTRMPDENAYLGDLRARRLRQLTGHFPAEADDLDRTALLFELGVAELRLGNERQAIDSLTKAAALLRSAEGPPDLILDANVQLALEMGIAYMRLAETQNCCQRNTPDSCIVPIRGDGIHTNQEPARKAIEHFTNALKSSEAKSAIHMRARWLLNIAYMTIGEYPDQVPEEYRIPVAAFESRTSIPRFINISSLLGINTFSLSGGAVADDFDGDNLLDLMVSTWDFAGQLRFFHNNGDGTFEDRSDAARLTGIIGGLNLVQADYNNDGHVDVLILRGAWLAAAGSHPNSLIRNNGDGTFTDVTFSSGLGDVQFPTQTASWADFNNDGHLDLFIGNEHGRGVTAPCQLFENQRDGTFKDVAGDAGVTNDRFAKAVVWGDFDNDRWPDLYVSNLYEENRLYKNGGDGTFVDVAPQLGCTRPLVSFPAWFFDIDNDGALDLFVSSYLSQVEDLAASYVDPSVRPSLPHLYKGNGRGRFEQVGREWNLVTPSAPMGANFGDLNGDGFLDFYLGTGDPEYSSLMPNVMYLNRAGRRFDDVTMAGGFGHLQKGHAVVFADLDHDGDQDVFEQLGGAYPGDKFFDALFENPGFGNHWLTIHLVGNQSNRSAIGARIRIDVTQDGTSRSIYKHVNSGGTFGANPLRQTIGLGKAERILSVEVFWPTTGQTQSFEDVPMDVALRIEEGEPRFSMIDVSPFSFSSQPAQETPGSQSAVLTGRTRH